jgi:hypothetical protein
LKGRGGLDQLQQVELPLEPPQHGEIRIRVRASGVGFTDISKRTGYYLFAPRFPFVEGYEVLGDVDAIGPGVTGFILGQRVCALTVYGGWAEYFTRAADHFVPVPNGLDDAEVIALILNYVTAWQMIHRTAAMQPGQTALVTGANGGVGTALLELLSVHKVRAFGSASRQHFHLIASLARSCRKASTLPSTGSAARSPANPSAPREQGGSSSGTGLSRPEESPARCEASPRFCSARAWLAAAGPSMGSPRSTGRISVRSKRIFPSSSIFSPRAGSSLASPPAFLFSPAAKASVFSKPEASPEKSSCSPARYN